MSDLKTLFETTEATKKRSLPGTESLTTVARQKAHAIWNAIEQKSDVTAELVDSYRTNSDVMDTLVAENIVIEEGELNFLFECDDATLEAMLKSIQSKRSRAKKVQETYEQFIGLLSAACAEYLLRAFMQKPKSLTRGRGASTTVFTEEVLNQLAEDQDELRRELRNIQSKKSIAKKKEGFSEESDVWKGLIHIEEELKARRIGPVKKQVVKVDTTKDKLMKLLGDKEATDIKPTEAKKLLNQLLEDIREANKDSAEV